MLETKLQVFFGKFAIYIIGFLLMVAIVCGGGWYVSGVELEGQRAKTDVVETQLEVSNASYNSIKTQFSDLTNELRANQEKALESHAILQANLKEVLEADKGRENMEKYLLNRQTETECVMPKDLVDAWRKM